PKRLRDARKKGQVAKSQDLTSALVLLVGVTFLSITGRFAGTTIVEAMREWTMRAATFHGVLDLATAVSALHSMVVTLALASAPFLLALMITAILGVYLQVGTLFATEALKPDIKKLNPMEAFKQKFFKSRPYIEMLKTLLKMTATVSILAVVLGANLRNVVGLVNQPILSGLTFVTALLLEIGWKVGGAFLVIGAADVLLQRYLHRKELRMTKQELKEEYKETEGNPHHKHALRQLHHEILSQSMAAAVQQADAVVVNPTHVAVALKYTSETMSAPTVVAKGADLMAAQIRKLAQEAGVPVCQNVPLARALYELDIQEEIPEALYEAVAVILRWVYDLANEKGRNIRHG